MTAVQERIDLSRRVVERWEAMGGPGGRLATTLEMIRSELAILSKMAGDHPDVAPEIRELSARYGALANKLRMGLN